MEFDILVDDSGYAIAKAADKKFVDDTDAPYGYSRHAIRVAAKSRRQAMNYFRQINKRRNDNNLLTAKN